MAGESRERPWDDYLGARPKPYTADFGALLAPARPGDRPGWSNQWERANPADDQETGLLAGAPAAGRPHRHARPRRLRFAALGARPRALAAISVISAAAVAAGLFLSLPSSPRGASATPCPASTGCGSPSAGPTSRVPSVPASPAAASPSPTVNPTAKAIPKSVTSSPALSLASGGPSLAPGSRISIEATSACCRTFSIAHDRNDNEVVITQVTPGSSLATRAAATWIVRQGLADSSCVSFESADIPGEYLRHQDFELVLDPDDGSSRFANDATFCTRPGNSGAGHSFAAYDDPSMFIRQFDYFVFTASDGGQFPWDASARWHHDTSWSIIQPWS